MGLPDLLEDKIDGYVKLAFDRSNFYICMAKITLDFVQSDITHNFKRRRF